MAKARKPFVSRKKRKEIDAARAKRETFLIEQGRKVSEDNNRPVVEGDKQPVALPLTATVGEFAELLQVPVVRVISQLVKNGVMASVTQRVDYDTMAIVADELVFAAELKEIEDEDEMDAVSTVAPINIEGGDVRPAIVTIMGHVDHGKTTLLDYIRKSQVAAGEHGGITQHIGAYQTEIMYEGQPRTITFLDTPGHEAFTALRSHGAQVTDIVVLVVASDDGIKPQTIEAINHAKQAGVSLLVAITKMDVPGANPDRVKQQLVEHGLVPEEWGGSTIVAPVSAVTGEGVSALLEYIALTGDLKDLRADPKATPQGVVIESHQEIGLGPVATLLIQNGTLRISDVIVLGDTYGKIRSMTNYRGERIRVAGPSTPVKVAGIEAIPSFGDSFAYVKSEHEAKELLKNTGSSDANHRRTISDISQAIAEGRANTFNIVLKADAQGSLEALRASINKMHEPGVRPVIIHGGIGDVSLTDIQLAAASHAVVFAFQVDIPTPIKKSAHNLGVTAATYKIIYDLLDQIALTLKGLVEVKKVKSERGRLKVKKVFRTSKEAQIIGGEISQGVALNKAFVTLVREGEALGEGKVISLQKGPEQVDELDAGQECGLSVQLTTKIQAGDVLIFAIEEEVIAAEVS